MKLGPRTGVALAAVAVLALEFGLGAAGYGREAVARAHPVLGWVKEPGQERTGHWGETVRINEHGFRDRAWPDPAGPDVPVSAGGRRGLRVAVLGNSHGTAAGLDVEDGFVRGIEDELRRRGAADAGGGDVVAMAVCQPSWALEQCAAAYGAVARDWRPDAVVLQLDPFSIRPVEPRPEASDFPLRGWIESTAIWDFCQRCLVRGGEVAAGRPAEARRARHRIRLVRADPLGPEVEREWRAARARVRALAAEVRADGARLVVVTIPTRDEVLDPAAPRAGLEWQRFCDAEGLLHVDPVARFRARLGDAPGETFALYRAEDPDHLSAAGHALVARAVADALLAPRETP